MSQKKVSVIIVDDEPEAIRLLSLMLEKIAQVELIGTADHVKEALRLVYRSCPDLILLDIEMPELSGFDLVRSLKIKGINSDVVFITAFDQYAIDAIKASAFDYILKPVGMDELRETITRYRHKAKGSHNPIGSPNKPGQGKFNHTYRINTRTGYILIDPQEIVFCEAFGNYTQLYMITGRKETITCQLGEFARRFSYDFLYRINRSYIINLNYLTRVDRKSRVCKVAHYESSSIPASKDRLSYLENIYHFSGEVN